MAHFIAEIEGKNGPASRLGSKKGGIFAHARAWHVGVTVEGSHASDGQDEFHIYATGGSSGSSPTGLLGVVRLVDGVATLITAKTK